MTHIFGPVPSRRLGLSLGVDLAPAKTCTYDCLYCEVGPTTSLTMERFAYREAEILAELEAYLKEGGGSPDVITLAGSGEPTLNLGLGRIIRAWKDLSDIPVAVLTNGALLHREEVRRELAPADIVLPSLDAGREETFRRLNRPVPGLTLALVAGGLVEFRREYRGAIWLEVMLLKGMNDSEPELEPLRRLLREIAPDKVQINTAVRPVAHASACALDAAEMAAAAAYLGDNVEVIASCRRRGARTAIGDGAFLAMLARRPMTARDLAQALGLGLEQVKSRLHHLAEAGLVSLDRYHREGFYRAAVADEG
ncbi:MAG: radical SAM protein [Deltaproteobacteria bacterium]|nr:radical SAM protein [Deltaproteobacteria bacterium]